MALFLTGLTGLQTRSQRLLFAHVGCSNRHALIQTHRLNPQPTALLWFRLNLNLSKKRNARDCCLFLGLKQVRTQIDRQQFAHPPTQ